MGLRIEEPYRPTYYYNPLVSPLFNFHNAMTKLGSRLPESGKVAELTKRIGYAIVYLLTWHYLLLH